MIHKVARICQQKGPFVYNITSTGILSQISRRTLHRRQAVGVMLGEVARTAQNHRESGDDGPDRRQVWSRLRSWLHQLTGPGTRRRPTLRSASRPDHRRLLVAHRPTCSRMERAGDGRPRRNLPEMNGPARARASVPPTECRNRRRSPRYSGPSQQDTRDTTQPRALGRRLVGTTPDPSSAPIPLPVVRSAVWRDIVGAIGSRETGRHPSTAGSKGCSESHHPARHRDQPSCCKSFLQCRDGWCLAEFLRECRACSRQALPQRFRTDSAHDRRVRGRQSFETDEQDHLSILR